MRLSPPLEAVKCRFTASWFAELSHAESQNLQTSIFHFLEGGPKLSYSRYQWMSRQQAKERHPLPPLGLHFTLTDTLLLQRQLFGHCWALFPTFSFFPSPFLRNSTALRGRLADADVNIRAVLVVSQRMQEQTTHFGKAKAQVS